jgi:hypothetical protein
MWCQQGASGARRVSFGIRALDWVERLRAEFFGEVVVTLQLCISPPAAIAIPIYRHGTQWSTDHGAIGSERPLPFKEERMAGKFYSQIQNRPVRRSPSTAQNPSILSVGSSST